MEGGADESRPLWKEVVHEEAHRYVVECGGPFGGDAGHERWSWVRRPRRQCRQCRQVRRGRVSRLHRRQRKSVQERGAMHQIRGQGRAAAGHLLRPGNRDYLRHRLHAQQHGFLHVNGSWTTTGGTGGSSVITSVTTDETGAFVASGFNFCPTSSDTFFSVTAAVVYPDHSTGLSVKESTGFDCG